MIIGVLNQKGGVGKTTLSVNLAGMLSRARSSSILLIDADPQGSALDFAAARQGDPLFSVIALPRPVIHKEIARIGRGFDHVLIDGPPRVSDLARSAIMASDIIVIPVQPSPYDVWSAGEIVKIVNEAKTFKDLQKIVFVVNRKIANTAIGRDVREALSSYPFPVLSATITQRVIFAEAAATGQVVWEIDREGLASKEIEAVLSEIMEG